MARVLCPHCEQMVVEDDVHSCWDAALLRRIDEAERAVLEAADAYVHHVELLMDLGTPHTCEKALTRTYRALIDTTNALRTLVAV